MLPVGQSVTTDTPSSPRTGSPTTCRCVRGGKSISFSPANWDSQVMSAPSDVLPSLRRKMVASRPWCTPLYLRATSSDSVVDMKEDWNRVFEAE